MKRKFVFCDFFVRPIQGQRQALKQLGCILCDLGCDAFLRVTESEGLLSSLILKCHGVSIPDRNQFRFAPYSSTSPRLTRKSISAAIRAPAFTSCLSRGVFKFGFVLNGH